MKRYPIFTLLLVLGLMGLLFLFQGCASAPVGVIHRVTAPSAPVVKGQLAKDAVILAAADKIDALAPAAIEQTTIQREAVASAPAAQVEQILAEKDAALKAYKDASADSDKIIADLRKETAALRAKETTTQQWTCRGIGLLCLVAAGLAAYFGGLLALPKAGMLGIAGLGFMALAQVLGAWWFLPAVGSVSLLAVIAVAIWIVKHRQDANFAAETLAKAELAKSTLAKIVPVIDQTYDALTNGASNAGQAVLTNLFATLSKEMNSNEKAVIHTVRAEAKTV